MCVFRCVAAIERLLCGGGSGIGCRMRKWLLEVEDRKTAARQDSDWSALFGKAARKCSTLVRLRSNLVVDVNFPTAFRPDNSRVSREAWVSFGERTVIGRLGLMLRFQPRQLE